MNRSLPLIAAALIAALLAPLQASAEKRYQQHGTILAAARDFIDSQLSERPGDETNVSVEPLDPRLRLGSCAEPLEAFLPAGGQLVGNTTIGVRCHEPKAWSIYISAKISIFTEVLVAARALPRGAHLNAQDVEFDRRDLSRLPYGYLTDPAELEGMMSKRRLNAGTVITPSSLKEAPMVKRGERVTLTIKSGGLRIHAAGTAMQEGSRGQRIRVRNINSKRVVEGVIIGPGLVEIKH